MTIILCTHFRNEMKENSGIRRRTILWILRNKIINHHLFWGPNKNEFLHPGVQINYILILMDNYF